MLNFSHVGLQTSQLIVSAALEVKDVGHLLAAPAACPIALLCCDPSLFPSFY